MTRTGHAGSPAERVAARVRAGGGALTMSLRELRDEFGIQRLTTAGRRRIGEELAEVGLVVTPAMTHLFLDDEVQVHERTATPRRPATWEPRAEASMRVPPPPREPGVPVAPRAPRPAPRGPGRRRVALWVAGAVAAVLLVVVIASSFGGGDEAPAPAEPAVAVAVTGAPVPEPATDPRQADYAAARRMAEQERYGAAALAMRDLGGYQDARRRAVAYSNRQAGRTVSRARAELAAGDLAGARRLLRAAEGWARLPTIEVVRGEIAAEQEAREAAARAAEEAAARQAAEAAATQAAEQAAAEQPVGGGCDPNYAGACVPLVSYDLDCADISGPVTVVGADPHGFDREGDGLGCESG